MFTRRHFVLQVLLFFLAACGTSELSEQKKLAVGVVSYGQGDRSIAKYDALKTHLESQLKTIVELEPAFNEVQAVQQIERQAWDVVFAPPGLAAIAISEARYLPLLSQGGSEKERSVMVVKQDSPLQKLPDLANQIIALGHEGSATGYYMPIFNLYGLTLAEIRFAPTPQKILEWIDTGQVAAGALSMAELEQYQSVLPNAQFRVLYRDSHQVPSGAVLVGPTVERNTQQQILNALESVPAQVAAAAGYVANTKSPDYDYLIKVVKRVRPIAKRIKEKPAPLY